MELLFTKRSKLIYWALQEPVTHVVVLYRGYVFHTNAKKGVHIEHYSSFQENNEIIYRLPLKTDSNAVLDAFVKYQDKHYDFIGAAYLGLRSILKRVKIRIPKANLWDVSGMLFCTEFAGETLRLRGASDLTPYQLYLILRGNDEK